MWADMAGEGKKYTKADRLAAAVLKFRHDPKAMPVLKKGTMPKLKLAGKPKRAAKADITLV